MRTGVSLENTDMRGTAGQRYDYCVHASHARYSGIPCDVERFRVRPSDSGHDLAIPGTTERFRARPSGWRAYTYSGEEASNIDT